MISRPSKSPRLASLLNCSPPLDAPPRRLDGTAAPPPKRTVVLHRDDARLSDAAERRVRKTRDMTFLWFVIWFIANNVGGHEPLLFNPVNAWTGTLILAIALDLGGAHALGRRRA